MIVEINCFRPRQLFKSSLLRAHGDKSLKTLIIYLFFYFTIISALTDISIIFVAVDRGRSVINI